MGLSQGLEADSVLLKRKFRWLFKIPDVAIDGVKTLPPRRGARPGYQFKEYDFQHLSETIYYPLKLDWKTINVVLYDNLCNENPVLDWLSKVYEYFPEEGDELTFKKAGEGIKRDCLLELYDGCGNIMEQWNFENAYPSSVDWGDLDMDSSDIVVADITLRYDRAWIVSNPQ